MTAKSSDREVNADECYVQTLHPSRRKGVMMQSSYYWILRNFIMSAIQKNKEIVFQQLVEDAIHMFPIEFDRNVAWYLLMVKLDLEARGEIRAFINNRYERLQVLRINKRKMYSTLIRTMIPAQENKFSASTESSR